MYIKHGMTKTKTYKVWINMKRRCYNPNEKAYKWYGARGIKVCDRWRNNFLNFLEDMGVAETNMQLDRIDNNGDYSRENCKWSTPIENSNNKRTNKIHTVNGVTGTIRLLSEVFKLEYSFLKNRVDAGKTGSDLISKRKRTKKMPPHP